MLPIPMLPVFNWGAAGTRRLEGGFPSLVGARERPSPRGSPRTCTEEAKPRREHCRRQPEGRASVCARPTAANMAALPAGGSQLVATETATLPGWRSRDRLRCGPPQASAACPLRPSGGNAEDQLKPMANLPTLAVSCLNRARGRQQSC